MLNKSSTKFIKRILILVVLAMVLALGVRVALESKELSKLVSPSTMRDILVFLVPFLVLAERNYTMAVKSFGIRALHVELSVLAGAYFFFLAVSFPAYWGNRTSAPKGCPWWNFLCSEDNVPQINYYLTTALFLLGACLLAHSVRSVLRSN